MSLNGLDDAKVVEAYEGATSEPGGWFLLAYEGRDAVRVLSRGNGGISEVRNAVAEYEETSPLYGFLKYRRRSVVIKYLPDNCSRIIQARVAVHFNAVCERFSPYDTMFEITSASELKDSKLSAACSLHTASCSTSSSTSSSRRRRLVEIAEEEEDDQRATKRQSTHDADDESRSQTACDRPPTAEPVSLNSDLASSPEQSKFAAATTSDVPLFVGVNERRTSLDSDTHTIGSYPYSKPRVKLGPRPSADTNGRPHTAGNFRPVSVIPAGFKIFGKSGKRGKAKDGSSLSPPQEETGGLDFSTSDGAHDRPTTSSSSILDSVSVPVPTPAQKKPIITPEKARLMKAMQLREKNKKSNVLPSSGDPMGDDELNNADDDLTQVSDEAIVISEIDYDKMTKDDSGVALEPSESLSHPDHTSDHATSDSRPASPLVDSSEADHDLSTKASSISESTDETVHAKEEAEFKDVGDTETPTEDASNGNSLGDESNVAGESVAGPAETVAEGTKDPITTIAELSTTSNIAEDAREGSTDHGESLGNVALPVSRFSVSAATGSDEGHGGSSETADASKKLERVDSKDSSPASPGLKPKISVQDLWAATKAASQSTVTPPPLATVDADTVEDGNARSSTEEAGLSGVSTEGTRRRSQVESIKTTDLERKKEEALDGAQSASLETSSPVAFSKTPTTPGFPFPSTIKAQDGGNSGATSPQGLRTVSNPVRGKLVVPSGVHPTPVRSMSSGPSSIQQASQQHLGANLVKKSNNIGSSISQRIKALEKLSAATGGEIPTVPVRDRPASTFFFVKKKEVSRPPFALDRANSFRTQTPPSPEQSQEASPEEGRLSRLERSGSVTSRLSMFEYPTSSTALGPRLLSVPGSSNSKARPESVCVMAKIVRDTGHTGSSSPEPPRDSYEYEHLDLKHSPLLVDQQPAPTAQVDEDAKVEQSPPTQDRENEVDQESKPIKSRPSLSIVKDFIKERRKSATPDAGSSPSSPGRAESVHGANPAISPRMTSSSSSHSSPSKERDATTSPTESVFGDDGKSTNGDKKLSRAGRFMRRLSNISGARSKNSPPPASAASKQEETHETAQSRPSTTGTPTIVSYMGDVNVQFPDNLLWKRRNMSLDSQGYLILSALPVQNGRPAPGTKRYHLGEFRTPYIPDVEVQELPNSVVLDFIEGSGVQVACEDRAGQLRVLQTLQEAHATRGTTYGL